ncbi:hypothetical protein SCP_0405030 [Sparassis crispa]|uniref:LIM zinc-binding domain-containing protein n=1 Tax=Sparassis crispa TaxID=139825 RepID=A0A401GJ19_9APHY|nr:hypothetical protein SCP_0405030 [Sparassis crispa]GBE82123.1 hypothetical protein SCP_0405030 [Sparassis crispa]
MAQLAPVAQGPARISQILPTVKCSSCNQPVPIADLGDHVCAPPPPLPALRQPMSPKTTASLLPQKFQNVVAFPRLQAPQQHQHPHQHPAQRQVSPLHPQPERPGPATPPPRERAPSSVSLGARVGADTSRVRAPSTASLNVRGTDRPSRARAPSTASSLSVRSDDRPERVPSPLARGGMSDVPGVLFPTRPEPAGPPRMPSPLSARSSPGVPEVVSRTGTPANYPPLPSSPAPRPRAPSTTSVRSFPLSANAIRHPVQSSPAPFASPTYAGRSSASALSPSHTRPRTASNASGRPSMEEEPEVFYSTGPRVAFTPAQPPPPRARAPSNASMRRPEHRSPILNDPPTRARAPSSASMRYPPPNYSPQLPPQRPRAASNVSLRRPEQHLHHNPASPPLESPPVPRVPEIDTKIGGAAGMAGVGRRGFAAAARAAMFTAPNSHGDDCLPLPHRQSMDRRRANAPKLLDMMSAANYSSVRVAAHTPPLSPHSATSSPSPHTPFSQKSPVSAGIPSPHAAHHPTTPTIPASGPTIASPVSPGGSIYQRDRIVPPATEPPKAPLPALPATPTTPTSIRLPFFEKFKNKLPDIDTTKPDPEPAKEEAKDNPLFSPSSGSEFSGLAYADSNAEDTEEDVRSPKPQVPSGTARPRGSSTGKDKVRFPSMDHSESHYSPVSPRPPMRSLSASTGASAYSARSAAKSTGALDRALETLFEDPTSPTASSAASPFTFPTQLVPDSQRDSKPPKLPVRSHTSPTLGANRDSARGKKRPQVKVCVRCEKTIDDERWIQMDGGSVLCDRCWKNMYLPKCRRCNLTIEKQAVSSSDGQLKGKYHRECFNCHTCHKTFPDKSFYVFDGKPFCAYHYHEANKSLCAAPTCGQPIEGPCAVSHAGQRYHPEHLLCEYARCTERLVEYYEVDGRMLCERHAQRVMKEGDEGEGEGDEDLGVEARDSTARAMKRVTRFIDLASLGESELR